MDNTIIQEVLKNINNIHGMAEMTMNDRKESHNITDNSTYEYATYDELERTVVKEIPVCLKECGKEDNLVKIIKLRKSVRDYSEKKVALEKVMKLLKYTFGYTRWTQGIYGFKDYPSSYIPSAGGLATLTNYLIVRNVEGLENGIYRYNRLRDSLEMLSQGYAYYKIPDVVYGLDFTISSAFSIFICANVERLVWKYGERSYRFVHMDAGVAAQNLHLLAVENGIASCMIAGYEDKETREYLNLQKNEIPMLLLTFGECYER